MRGMFFSEVDYFKEPHYEWKVFSEVDYFMDLF